jgi:hypothetical protein
MKSGCLFLACCLAVLCGQAQGPQQLVTVPIGPGSSVPGWLYLPADYSSTTNSYPVILFFHGSGEAGTDPARVLRNGIPRMIANGVRPDSIVNPADGKKYSFIVLSPQHWSWSPSPDWIPAELEWLKKNYRIDTTRIYVSGLSAGGQESFNAITYNDAVSRLIAAAVPMSPAALGPYDISMIGKYHIKSWFLSGSTDDFTNNAKRYSAEANSVYPGSSRVTVFTGGHCCWATYYNPSWKDSTTGLSVLQWMLTNQRLTSQAVLPVKFTDFKVTDLGNKRIRVDFSYEDADGDENFYIRINIKGQIRNVLIKPEDRTGPGKYSKTLNLNQ